jgi:hypothetical protein
MKRSMLAVGIAVLCCVLFQCDTSAASLTIQPLKYNEQLKNGEKKRGFIDVTNPTSQDVTLVSDVQGFRQVDNKGSLEFFDSEQLNAGVKLDYNEFKLSAGHTMRVVFEVDGSKLPSGNVFGVIFFQTKPGEQKNSSGSAQSVRLGTLLILTNGTPVSHSAKITSVLTSAFQFGNRIEGTYTIMNTDGAAETGFFPVVTISMEPLRLSKQQTSSLVFPGRERANTFFVESNRFGLYQLRVGYGSSMESRWVFVVTGFWRWLVPILIALIILALIAVRIFRRHKPSLQR